MARFDQCSHGLHNDCIKKYQRYYIGIIGKGRNKRTGPVFIDEWAECSCKCHKKEK